MMTQSEVTNGGMGWITKCVLATVLCLTLGVVTLVSSSDNAYAADGSVTFELATPAANPNATYDAYAFFYANVDATTNKASDITWALSETDRDALIAFLGVDYTTWLTTNNHTEANAAINPANACEYISTQIGTSAGINTPRWVDAGTFASNLASWTRVNLTKTATTVANTAYTAAEGYYLFVTSADSLGTGEMGSAAIWFALGGSATTVTEKAALPTITKEVQEDSTNAWGKVADAEIGQDVNFRITVTAPADYRTFDTFYGQVTDTLPVGMTLDTADVTVTLGEADITNDFTVAFTNQVLTVTCDNLKAIAGIQAGSTIVVSYNAHLTSTSAPVFGGTGNVNEATFTYSNDPTSATHGTTSPVDAKVYTFQLQIVKADTADTAKLLAGAQFVIKNAENKYLAADGSWSAATTADALKLTTDENGAVSAPGLDEGTYTLTEVTGATGYKRYDGDITVTLTAAYDAADGSITQLDATVTGGLAGTGLISVAANTGIAQVRVTNDGVSLALTGGVGIGLGGALIVVIGVGIYLIQARRKGRDAK